VEVLDVVTLLREWGSYPAEQELKSADFNGDHVVDARDLLILIETLASGGPLDPAAPAPTPTQLAGRKLPQYPHFEYVRAFNQGSDFHVAIDPTRFPTIVGDTCRLYVVKKKTPAQWAVDPSLTDVTPGGFQVQTFPGGTIQAQTFLISGGSSLNGTSGTRVGIGYDVVLDCNQNAVLDSGDFIDGLSLEAGMYVVRNTAAAGPYSVAELNYDIPNWADPPPVGWGGTAGYQNENIFYPSNLTSDILLPLIVVSRGNGHDHNWYDHIGNHMGSYGYVVMSHNNETEPGVESAATTTLLHTDAFIAELPNIAGGVLNGSVDTNQIVWIGHSRGGEGVTIAYDRLFDGGYKPVNYSSNSIRLISSIAPVDFLGGTSNPGTAHGVAYHLWTGVADDDVMGCACCNLCQTFHLHDRAEQYRQSISLYGVGHGYFHNDPTQYHWASGPCLLGWPKTHAIMRGYLLPLVKRYLEKDIPSKDFLTRQWENFKPIGAPAESPCLPPMGTGVDVVVDLMYRDGPVAGNFMIDDFQTQPSLGTSSSGGSVSFVNTTELAEGNADDNDLDFTWTTSDLMNAVILAGDGDDSKALAFSWNGPASVTWKVIDAQVNFTDNVYLSFRAAQASRHAFTISALGDLTFHAELIDSSGDTSRINIGAYGGGLEDPYQRDTCLFCFFCGASDSCGDGTGWSADFETIRIRLTDFLNNGSGLNLSKIVAVRFSFGSSDASPQGRIIVDELEVTRD
jgi:hypothetical protein